jgi:short-subunit dehydrogenase
VGPKIAITSNLDVPVGSHPVQIQGATVLLTGATGGLGQAIARELSQRGANLILSGRQREVLDLLATELGARPMQADLAQASEVERLAVEAGDVDILVANAGLQGIGRLESFDVEELDQTLQVNLRAPIVLARLLMGPMVKRGRGHLLFMSSVNGKAATPRTSLYAATKFGLRGFAHSLRADLRASGVGVSVLCPGFISDVGMFARSRVKLPPGVGTRVPRDVAEAVVVAIEHNRGELDVAPLPVRVGSAFGGLTPELFAKATRLARGEEVADTMVANVRSSS